MFAAVKVIKIADPNKYKYSGYVIRFDAPETFPLLDGNEICENLILLGVDINSSLHINIKKRDTLILGIGLIDGSANNKSIAEK